MEKNREVAEAIYDRINVFCQGWDTDVMPMPPHEFIVAVIERALDNNYPNQY